LGLTQVARGAARSFSCIAVNDRSELLNGENADVDEAKSFTRQVAGASYRREARAESRRVLMRLLSVQPCVDVLNPLFCVSSPFKALVQFLARGSASAHPFRLRRCGALKM
jgi:hypothetical protein